MTPKTSFSMTITAGLIIVDEDSRLDRTFLSSRINVRPDLVLCSEMVAGLQNLISKFVLTLFTMVVAKKGPARGFRSKYDFSSLP